MKRSTLLSARPVARALVVLVLLVAGAVPSLARSYRVDSARIEIAVEIGPRFYPLVHGVFRRFTSSILIDLMQPEHSMLRFTVASASLDTGTSALDSYVRGPGFLDAADYPTIHFVSTKVEKLGEHRMRVTGNLTLRGVTRPETFMLEVQPGVGSNLSLRAEGEVRRSAFGMTSGLPIVPDNVRILVTTRADGP